MFLPIIACVLAIVVPLVVGVGLLIYVQNRHQSLVQEQWANYLEARDTFATSLATLQERLTTLTDRVSRCESGIERTSSTHVAAEVAALAADVEKIANLQRKQFGRVWAELHHDGVLKRNGASQQDVETPEQVRERLRREHGLPKLGRVQESEE